MVQFIISALLVALLAAPSLASHVAHEYAHEAHADEAIEAPELRIERFLKKAGSTLDTPATVAGGPSTFLPTQRDLEGVEELDARFGRGSGTSGSGPRRSRLMAREPRKGGRKGGKKGGQKGGMSRRGELAAREPRLGGRKGGMSRGRMMRRDVEDVGN